MKIDERGARAKYKTAARAAKSQSIKDIFEKCPKTPNHVIFVWTIDKYLRKTEEMFSNYKLHARIVWDKGNGIAPAFTVRYSHEYLLWFYREKMLPINPEFRGKYTTILREPARKHSQKPLCAYEMIENLYPDAFKLELFARPQLSFFSKRTGWDVWGNEIKNDISL